MSYLFLYISVWVSIVLSILYGLLLDESVFPPHMVNLILIGLFPIFFALWWYIRETTEHQIVHDIWYPPRLILALMSIIVLVMMVESELLTLISLILCILVLMLGLDARILFAVALVDIIAVPLLLIMMQDVYAEYFAVQAYYALVLGVLGLIVDRRLIYILDRYLPHMTLPKWWDGYILELRSLLSLLREYVPYVIIGLLTLSYSPWQGAVEYDERFVATMSITLALWTLVPACEWQWAERWAYALAWLCGLMLFAMYSEYIVESILALVVYTGCLYLAIYQRPRIDSYIARLSSLLTYDA